MDYASSVGLIKTVLASDDISNDALEGFLSKLHYESHKKNTILFHQTDIASDIFLITEGIIAAQSVIDEKEIITRFFRQGDTCMNIVNTVLGEMGIDNLICMTPVSGFRMSYKQFNDFYHSPSSIGHFMREKVLEELVITKQVTSAKIMYKSNDLDLYLREHYPDIIRDVPSKYIAMFMGISPEAYSRLLTKRFKNN